MYIAFCDLFHNLSWGVALVILAANTPSLQAQDSANSQANQITACDSPEAHQFDFWIGDWNLTWKGGSGRNTITADYNGCVIREDFRTNPDTSSSPPFAGMSISVYIPAKKQWKQTWVDNAGAYLDFVGGFDDGKMTIGREFEGKAGQTVRQRMVFYNITTDSFDWNWESSIDNGGWTLSWKIHYERRK